MPSLSSALNAVTTARPYCSKTARLRSRLARRRTVGGKRRGIRRRASLRAAMWQPAGYTDQPGVGPRPRRAVRVRVLTRLAQAIGGDLARDLTAGGSPGSNPQTTYALHPWGGGRCAAQARRTTTGRLRQYPTALGNPLVSGADQSHRMTTDPHKCLSRYRRRTASAVVADAAIASHTATPLSRCGGSTIWLSSS